MLAFAACNSQQALVDSLSARVSQLQSDSAAMERRLRQLSDENSYLSEKCAAIEQALTYRIQEKEDSLRLKEQALNERELNLKDMKARKEQEQDAFDKLSKSVFQEFAALPEQIRHTRTSCSQVIVEFTDKVFFSANSLKPDTMRALILTRVSQLLKRNEDLRLTVTVISDSVVTAKEKPEDSWAWSSMRANAIVRELIKDYQINAQVIQAASANQRSEKSNSHLGKNRVMLVFQSAYLPCIHK